MSQGSMSKGTFFCRGKMRGSWEGYLGMGAAALADHLQLPHQCKETQGHTYFSHQTLKLWEHFPVKVRDQMQHKGVCQHPTAACSRLEKHQVPAGVEAPI